VLGVQLGVDDRKKLRPDRLGNVRAQAASSGGDQPRALGPPRSSRQRSGGPEFAPVYTRAYPRMGRPRDRQAPAR
jgi:hypothetical protein